jgi:predicted nucleotidyltransferase component of viral defense system
MEHINLKTGAVDKNLLQLLEQLMISEELKHFYLVGGTALALHLGYRKSIDIDLFYHDHFDSALIADYLNETFEIKSIEVSKNLVRCFINDIKVDIMSHRYPLVDDIYIFNNIRLASLKDLAAMKLNAVTNRGMKKDFWDIGILLDIFSLKEMLKFYHTKYPDASLWQVEKSLSWLGDADNEQTEIIDLKGYHWQTIKKKILAETKKLLK